MALVGKTLSQDSNLNIVGYAESLSDVVLYVSSYNDRNLALDGKVIEGKIVRVVIAT